MAQNNVLTEAELAITELIVKGNSIKQIADKRGVSPSTVRTQLNKILSKKQIHSVSELIRIELTKRIEELETEKEIERYVKALETLLQSYRILLNKVRGE